MPQLKFSNSFLYKTGERIIPGSVSNAVLSEHYSRYIFASEFCQNKKVLNVASGCGYGSEVLLKTASEIFNVDIDGELVAYGNNKYGNCKNHFLKMDAQNLQFPEEFFDSIVSFETFEHLPDYKKFITECRRVLKSNGSIVLSMPNKIISSPWLEKPVNRFHFKEWEYNELISELRNTFDIHGVFGQHFITPIIVSSNTEWSSILRRIIYFCYDLMPSFIFKLIKKYYLGYKEIRETDIVVESIHRINRATGIDFHLDNSGRAYAIIILILSKK